MASEVPSDKQAEGPQEKTTEVELEANLGTEEEAPPAEAGDEVKEKLKAEVTPRTKVHTTNPAEGVDIAMGTEGIESEEPVTIGHVFRQTVKKYPDRDALGYKEGEEWKYIKYPEYYQLCVSAAKSFIKVRDRDSERVLIFLYCNTFSLGWRTSMVCVLLVSTLKNGLYQTQVLCLLGKSCLYYTLFEPSTS